MIQKARPNFSGPDNHLQNSMHSIRGPRWNQTFSKMGDIWTTDGGDWSQNIAPVNQLSSQLDQLAYSQT